jgi:hypothetical protein
MRRALASIRFSPAVRPRLASRPARSRTTSTTWTRSPDPSFSRFALYRCDQLRASSPLSMLTPQPISKLSGVVPEDQSWLPGCQRSDILSCRRSDGWCHACWFTSWASRWRNAGSWWPETCWMFHRPDLRISGRSAWRPSQLALGWSGPPVRQESSAMLLLSR